jgi:hypothetical protein
MENSFFQPEDKAQFLDCFCKIQKHYFGFMRLLNMWKYKRTQLAVSDDLYLNPLETNGKNIFVLVQNRKKYLFSIANLINMTNAALSNASHFFASPLVLKNPYNNMVFKKSDLYNLYFAIKNSTFIMPVLFQYYFLVNFDIHKFRSQYEGIIRDISIDNYVKNTDCCVLYDKVFDMLKEHKTRFSIDDDFPKETLVNIMRPYLKLYYFSVYSMDEYKKLNAFSDLHTRLHKFYRFNPKFGRKTVKRECNVNFKFIKKITYNDDHPNTEKVVCIEEFMTNHDEHDDYYETHEDDEEETVVESTPAASNHVLIYPDNYQLNSSIEMLFLQSDDATQSMEINDDNESYKSDSDSDTDSDFQYIRRNRATIESDDEPEYQELTRNMLSADENQQPITQTIANEIILTEESESESESDDIVIQGYDSESESDFCTSDIDE